MFNMTLDKKKEMVSVWRNLDDETVGKAVKELISNIDDYAGYDMIIDCAAALILCCSASKTEDKKLVLEIGKLILAGKEIGDWSVVAQRVEAHQ